MFRKIIFCFAIIAALVVGGCSYKNKSSNNFSKDAVKKSISSAKRVSGLVAWYDANSNSGFLKEERQDNNFIST